MSAAVICMLLLQACGQDKADEGSGESFAAVAEASGSSDTLAAAAATAAPQASAEASPAVENSPAVESAAVTPGPAVAEAPAAVLSEATATAAEDKVPASSKPSSRPFASAAAVTQKPTKKTAGSIPGAASPSPVQGASPEEVKDAEKNSAEAESAKAGSVQAASPSQPARVSNPKAASSTGNTEIDWNGFFDGTDQTRPSERFWDLTGSKVTIKGFMGEVLSFEKNWFLLIPEPGAECPFDNGDETYWNKIMIVFVPEGSKLRYTSGPLEISGRLDVGIKIDESGYKTMFRLYDASFKSL
ncbi:hypothetical protein JRJ22_26440 [Paenibacillus tianjinensis]|uniref:Lipoprotein n=2 Tax=Paenibacillus tianjinensis TaxID=2810347 RepID=A0ABX7LKU3_9BACL|nr:hypothetical protein JRJ22_26440 [Paenibacillus tianjinensis]